MAQSSTAVRSREVRAAIRRAGAGDIRVSVQSRSAEESAVFVAGFWGRSAGDEADRTERQRRAARLAEALTTAGIAAEVITVHGYPYVRVAGPLA